MANDGDSVTFGIIGGNGAMGGWFKRFLERNGQQVIVSDKGTGLTNEELARIVDVVVFSVPIRDTVKVIESIIPHVSGRQCLMDLTSLKSLPVTAMLSSGCEVLGTHPMFGPTLESPRGQTIVFCKARPGTYTPLIEQIFVDEGVIIKEAGPDTHDDMMSVIQGLTHFNTIVLGKCMMDLGIDIKESMKFTSPIYRMRMDMVGRILAQDASLYADIEIQNPHTLKNLRAFMDASSELFDIIERKDSEAFMKLFDAAASYFGSYKDEALKSSDVLIDKMSEISDRDRDSEMAVDMPEGVDTCDGGVDDNGRR